MSPTPHLPRRRSLLVGGAALATTAATPALFGIARAQGGPIKIGFPVPLTGAFSAEAQDQVRAAELAVKEWNAAGGHKGQMAELLVRDDKLNPGEAATRTLELIAPLEKRTGVPVISSMPHGLWAGARLVGLSGAAPGYGRLLSRP